MIDEIKKEKNLLPFIIKELPKTEFAILVDEEMLKSQYSDSYVAIDIKEYYNKQVFDTSLDGSHSVVDVLIVAQKLPLKEELKEEYCIYIIEMKNKFFEKNDIYKKFKNTFEDFIEKKFKNIFIDNDYQVKLLKLYTVSNIYRLGKCDNKTLDLKLLLSRNPNAFKSYPAFEYKGKVAYIEYDIPELRLRWD
jgi:hypothetical protein